MRCARPNKVDEALKPMRTLGKPAFDHVGPAFPAVRRLFDPLFVSGLQWYRRADNVEELSDEAFARHGSLILTMLPTMHLYPVNGAALTRLSIPTPNLRVR